MKTTQTAAHPIDTMKCAHGNIAALCTDGCPPMIECEHDGCVAAFYYVPERTFPTLCLDHSDDASRSAHGWTPENSL